MYKDETDFLIINNASSHYQPENDALKHVSCLLKKNNIKYITTTNPIQLKK